MDHTLDQAPADPAPATPEAVLLDAVTAMHKTACDALDALRAMPEGNGS